MNNSNAHEQRDHFGRLLVPLDERGPFLEVYKLHPEARLPTRGSPQSVGYDLSALILTETGRPSTRLVRPSNTVAIETGIAVVPPPGYFCMMCSRSSIASHSVVVANSPGIIDPDYTGEIKVLLLNSGWESFNVKHEWRIAQLVLMPVSVFPVKETRHLPQTARGDKGFGSTGR